LTIISADYLLVCDEEFTVLQKCAIYFDKEIKEVASQEVLTSKYPNAKLIECEPNTVLMPGLINIHVHLEFSANKTTLKYGDFITWLNSVIEHRDELSVACDEEYIDYTLDEMLKSGTTTIGAISSFGVDLNSCLKSPINVVYFNEVLGSNPAAVDALFGDFLARLEESRAIQNDGFTPAISIHSPYSTHPILAKKALEIAKASDMVVSTHFMESDAERSWLDSGSGDFKLFFENFAPNAKPVNDAISYLELFTGQKVLFTHAVKADAKELKLMQEIGTITHCPVSNRLLGNDRLEIEKLDKLTVATDGLSSNNSLSLWDELRAALMMHFKADANLLAKKLIKSVTLNAANALDKRAGVLTSGYEADMITVKLPDSIKDIDSVALFLILHAKKADKIFIKGEEII
jgi:cytosine/adenosine deaminase-related metal-dependent hydrolase